MPAPRLIDAAVSLDTALRALFPKARLDTPRVTELRQAAAGVRQAVLAHGIGADMGMEEEAGDPMAILELALAHCREWGVASEKIIAATTRAVHGRAEPPAFTSGVGHGERPTTPKPGHGRPLSGKDAAAGEGLE